MSDGLWHLVRRALTSLSNHEPTARGTDRAREVLNEGEFALWSSMQARDRRHSLDVLARFDSLRPGADGVERAAALLHDVGKSASPVGWAGRVVATIAGGRTAAMRTYLDHERIGAGMIAGVSDPRTVDLVSGRCRDDAADALRRADGA